MYGPDKKAWYIIMIFGFMGATLGIWKLAEIIYWIFTNIKVIL
jgi:carbon starvation protein CstA